MALAATTGERDLDQAVLIERADEELLLDTPVAKLSTRPRSGIAITREVRT